jgi:hypothetical protein
MTTNHFKWIAALIGCGTWALSQAQPLPNDARLLPASPTSADVITLSIPDTTCGNRYLGDSYRVSMAQNAITVTLGQKTTNPTPVCPSGPREDILIGRLPAGSYTLTANSFAPAGAAPAALFTNYAFTVADARIAKVAPHVRLDFSGQWWDPGDPGWGLFIWQDARGASDSLLAAWFTYAADGKPNWYVFQPRWLSSTVTEAAPLANSTRLPGAGSPPPTTGTPAVMGMASLDFTNLGSGDDAKITYTFTGGPTLTRTIKRFKP